jgi:predicted site-specific integrase-resolvase
LDTRHRVTLQEASQRLSVPIGTLYSWASQGRLRPVAIEPGGKKWFALADLEKLAATTTRRKKTGDAGNA